MPTGYTADVESGKVTEFRQFALQCARAFGACVMQRDDDMRELPKLREPSDYHTKELERARADYHRYLNMTDEQAERAAAEDYARQVKQRVEAIERQAIENGRYLAMLAEVEAWEPPTKDHQGLKDFMAQQLRDSMRDWIPSEPVRHSAREWKEKKLQQASTDIRYHTKEMAKEAAQVNDSNQWIRDLYDSLNAPVSA